MATKYIPRKHENIPTKKVLVLLKKGISLRAQIKDTADAIKKWCPEIFRKDDPYPTVRMVKFKEGEIVYEITEGKGSRAKVGPV